MNNKEKFYITTSIAYANSSPHIGYATELLQADSIARFQRLKGNEVFFLTGTDEHGLKIKRKAEENGKTPKEFVDETSKRFKELARELNISNDDFIRTSDKERHYKTTQKIWQKLEESDDIYEKTYEGKYCVGCEEFINDRDLVDGKCPFHQKEPEKIEEKNYFFKLSKYLPKIKELIKNDEIEIIPISKKNEIINIIEEAEKEKRDVSFSRPKSTLDWGIPIPNSEDQVMYVWCDALTNYISALDYASEDNEKFKKFWPADMHIIGKDILRFHAMIWPAILLSAKLPLPKKICVHGFITSGGQKMSKSLGNVIDPFELIEKYGIEPVRYFLLKEISTTEDGDFSYEKFETVYKADLQNGLGNLVSRVLAMTEKYFDGKVPEISEKYKEETKLVELENIEEDFSEIQKEFDSFKLNSILEKTEKNIKTLDGYIQKHEPFKLIKENPEKTANVIYNCLEGIRIIAWTIKPFLPETSDNIFRQLFTEGKERKQEMDKNIKEAMKWGDLPKGITVKKGETLFPRIEE